MTEEEIFRDWEHTVIMHGSGRFTCGKCEADAAPEQGCHLTDPSSKPVKLGCGVEWRYAATTLSDQSRETLSKLWPQFPWVGVVDMYVGGAKFLRESWLEANQPTNS